MRSTAIHNVDHLDSLRRRPQRGDRDVHTIGVKNGNLGLVTDMDRFNRDSKLFRDLFYKDPARAIPRISRAGRFLDEEWRIA